MKKIALVLALALCAVILSGCAEINSLVSGVTGGNFKGGNAVITDKIENLNISWTAGSVKIAYHAENTVTLDETASRSISACISFPIVAALKTVNGSSDSASGRRQTSFR